MSESRTRTTELANQSFTLSYKTCYSASTWLLYNRRQITTAGVFVMNTDSSGVTTDSEYADATVADAACDMWFPQPCCLMLH